MLGRFITASASLPGTKDDSTYIVQTLDFHLGHNTMVTKPCGALESPMATITKITRRRHENPPHGVATVKEWFNYVTAMRNEGSGEFLSPGEGEHCTKGSRSRSIAETRLRSDSRWSSLGSIMGQQSVTGSRLLLIAETFTLPTLSLPSCSLKSHK